MNENFVPQWLKLLRFMVAGNELTVKNAANLFDCYCLHKRIADIYRYTGIVCDSEMKKSGRSVFAVHTIKNPKQWKKQLLKAKIYLRQEITLKPSYQG